jgi:hypothetical protein
MASESSAVDPYRSPVLPEYDPLGRSRGGRPTGITVLCVLCIVLGALGLMNSLMGTLGAVAGPQLQRILQPKAGPSEMQKAQEKFQQEVNDVQAKFFTPLILGLGFRFLVAMLLLIGGVRTLSLHENGRKMLVVACALALIFEMGHAVLQSMISMEMMVAFNSLTEGILASAPDDKKMPPDFAKTMGTVMRITFLSQFVLMFGLVLAKGALYIFGYVYLQKQRIKALFQPA